MDVGCLDYPAQSWTPAKEKTGTFHTEKHQGRENKGKGKEGENGWMKLWGKKCFTKKSAHMLTISMSTKLKTAGMGMHLQTDHRPLVLKVLFVVNVFQLHENEWALIQEIMYDTLYLKTSFLIF